MESRQRKPMSRREMLRLAASAAGVTAVGSILAACGEQPTSTTVAPTAAPAAGAAATAPAGGAAATAPAGGAAPTAASVATAPTNTPQLPQSFGSESAKIKLRYWTI